jgi:hypothetical protein
LRILLLIPDLGIGGAQKQFIETAIHLSKAIDLEFQIVCINPNNEYLVKNYRKIDVIYLRQKHGILSLIGAFSKYLKVLFKFKPNIVHSWLGRAHKFSLYGIYEKTCARQYYTTIDILLSMWKRTETPEDEGILKVLKNLANQSDLLIDEDLYEDYYNYYDRKNFNQESFDRVVKSNLDKIEEKINEQSEEGDLVKNREIYEKISKLGYKFGVWYDLPTQKNYGEKTNQVFRLDRVEKGKIELIRKDRGISYGNAKQSKMSFEDFLNYLYHPELFN